MREKKNSFPEVLVEIFFYQMLAQGEITLPPPKRPNEGDKINNPKYWKYYHLVSHTLKDCSAFKDMLQELTNNGKVVIDSPKDEATSKNTISVMDLKAKPTLYEKTIKNRF